MVRLTAHYDGKVLVPDEPVELPTGVRFAVTVQQIGNGHHDDPILALDGLGAEVWDGVDPVEYQRGERAGWK